MRSRIIKPGFFINEDIAKCDPVAQILFIGLWCLADREGRLEDRPKRIWALLLPYNRECDTDQLLNELADKGFILRYEANGQRCIQIINFVIHQKPHPKEAPSELPAPDQESIVYVPRKLTYFIQGKSGSPIKIGSAANPRSRLSSIQTGHPDRLRILGVVDQKESSIQKRFAESRINGEWFRVTEELIEFIKTETVPLERFEERQYLGKDEPCKGDTLTRQDALVAIPSLAFPSFPSSFASAAAEACPSGDNTQAGLEQASKRSDMPKATAPRTRKPDDLFDAVAEVTASDPVVSGSHVGRLCKLLRAADPAYTSDEVRAWAKLVRSQTWWKGNPPSLGYMEKDIGRIRAQKPVQSGEESLKSFLLEHQQKEEAACRN